MGLPILLVLSGCMVPRNSSPNADGGDLLEETTSASSEEIQRTIATRTVRGVEDKNLTIIVPAPEDAGEKTYTTSVDLTVFHPSCAPKMYTRVVRSINDRPLTPYLVRGEGDNGLSMPSVPFNLTRKGNGVWKFNITHGNYEDCSFADREAVRTTLTMAIFAKSVEEQETTASPAAHKPKNG